MSDSYYHDADGIASVVNALKSDIDSYKGKISEIDTLINEINGSSAWKDAQVKTSFIETCQSYMTIYKELTTSMENYVSGLSDKSDGFSSIESAFSR